MVTKNKIRKIGNYLLAAQSNLTKKRIKMEGIRGIVHPIAEAIRLLKELDDETR